jgi:hypothetical protein
MIGAIPMKNDQIQRLERLIEFLSPSPEGEAGLSFGRNGDDLQFDYGEWQKIPGFNGAPDLDGFILELNQALRPVIDRYIRRLHVQIAADWIDPSGETLHYAKAKPGSAEHEERKTTAGQFPTRLPNPALMDVYSEMRRNLVFRINQIRRTPLGKLALSSAFEEHVLQELDEKIAAVRSWPGGNLPPELAWPNVPAHKLQLFLECFDEDHGVYGDRLLRGRICAAFQDELQRGGVYFDMILEWKLDPDSEMWESRGLTRQEALGACDALAAARARSAVDLYGVRGNNSLPYDPQWLWPQAALSFLIPFIACFDIEQGSYAKSEVRKIVWRSFRKELVQGGGEDELVRRFEANLHKAVSENRLELRDSEEVMRHFFDAMTHKERGMANGQDL